MKEILPGIFHWTALHDRIRIQVSSYYLAEAGGLLIDPQTPADGVEWFRDHGPPQGIVLTNRHHYRHSARFAEAYGCPVWCHEAGVHEFKEGPSVKSFEFGHEFDGGVVALEVGVICPEETALYVPGSPGALVFADGIVREGSGPLAFVPEKFLGEDPKAVKQGLKAAFRSLLDRDFDHLLLAHGEPWIGDGKSALRSFAAAD